MEPTPTPDATRGRSDNDQKLAADITRWERVLTAARDDDEAQATLSESGYGPERLDGLLALVASARTAYKARTAGMSAEEAASEAKKQAEASARSSYRAFRRIARAVLADDADALTRLGLNDPEARALDPFVTQARSGYEAMAGLDGDGPARMAEAGYPAERLGVLSGEVADLVEATRAFTSAEARAKRSTRSRDVEGDAARKAYGVFREIAEVVLPPHLRDRIGLG